MFYVALWRCGDFCCYLEVVWYYGYVVLSAGLGDFVRGGISVQEVGRD